ncbi:MAG: hypothetical protein K0S45_1703 [Nitrospira sp.]|jgi:hypothetical protein|nr:hypothetical protein [Nitrospira sp.]
MGKGKAMGETGINAPVGAHSKSTHTFMHQEPHVLSSTFVELRRSNRILLPANQGDCLTESRSQGEA